MKFLFSDEFFALCFLASLLSVALGGFALLVALGWGVVA